MEPITREKDMSKSKRSRFGDWIPGGVSCGCFLLALIVNLTVGGYAFDYSLRFIAGKDIPWYADVIVGTVLGEVTIPLAVVCWVLKMCGVHSPLL